MCYSIYSGNFIKSSIVMERRYIMEKQIKNMTTREVVKEVVNKVEEEIRIKELDKRELKKIEELLIKICDLD